MYTANLSRIFKRHVDARFASDTVSGVKAGKIKKFKHTHKAFRPRILVSRANVSSYPGSEDIDDDVYGTEQTVSVSELSLLSF